MLNTEYLGESIQISSDAIRTQVEKIGPTKFIM